jgi:hypothetical protein
MKAVREDGLFHFTEICHSEGTGFAKRFAQRG